MKNAIIQNPIIQNFDNAVILEGMTSISALISALDSGKSRRKIYKILLDNSRMVSKKREISFLKIKSQIYGFDINIVDTETIDSVASGSTHGGIIAVCSDTVINRLSPELVKKDGIYYIFEGVEDPYNFGYMIRSVYASGADGIIMSERNWMSAASTVAKSSAGTSELLDMFICDPSEAVDIFKSLGYKVVSAGIRDSVTLYEADLSKPILVVIGGEKRGISRSILEKSDSIIRIDYGRQFKGSLPSVSATSIISFEILRKNSKIN